MDYLYRYFYICSAVLSFYVDADDNSISAVVDYYQVCACILASFWYLYAEECFLCSFYIWCMIMLYCVFGFCIMFLVFVDI